MRGSNSSPRTRSRQGYRIWKFPTGRPCERRDPSVSAKRSSRRRGLSLRHSSRGLFSLLRPGVMGPCVRRDDLLRDCTRPRPINVRLNSVICDSPAARGGRSRASCERVRGTLDRLRLADRPPHPKTSLRAVSDLSPQAGRGQSEFNFQTAPFSQTQLRDLAAHAREFFRERPALENRGRRESRVPAAPAASCAKW